MPKKATVPALRKPRRKGMGGAIDDVAEALEEAERETPGERLNRLLMAEPFDVWIRKPRKYIEAAPGVVSTPEFVYSVYYNATNTTVTKVGLCRRLGIDETTLYDWIKHKPLLGAAVRAGEALQEERLASRMAEGIKYPQSMFAVLKNLHHWTDRTEEKLTMDISEAMKQQSESARRVQWDRARPAIGGILPAPAAAPAKASAEPAPEPTPQASAPPPPIVDVTPTSAPTPRPAQEQAQA